MKLAGSVSHCTFRATTKRNFLLWLSHEIIERRFIRSKEKEIAHHSLVQVPILDTPFLLNSLQERH
jgi:hypothetical protein